METTKIKFGKVRRYGAGGYEMLDTAEKRISVTLIKTNGDEVEFGYLRYQSYEFAQYEFVCESDEVTGFEHGEIVHDLGDTAREAKKSLTIEFQESIKNDDNASESLDSCGKCGGYQVPCEA